MAIKLSLLRKASPEPAKHLFINDCEQSEQKVGAYGTVNLLINR